MKRVLGIRELVIAIGLLSLFLSSGSCTPAPSFNQRLSSIVGSHKFSVVGWESRAILRETGQWLFSKREKTGDDIKTVEQYFSLVARIKTLESAVEAIDTGNKPGDLSSLKVELARLSPQKVALAGTVDRVIEGQIKDILAQAGIFNPVDRYLRLRVHFPPLNFKLEKPPHLLVISPRDRIESMREIILRPDIKLEEIEDVEARIDRLGVSSLVVELGGLGSTYPTLVTNKANLRFTIDTATEEWLHQYLAFKPLGFLYLLDLSGLSRNYEIATMNETLAGMVSREIGAMVYEEYYPRYETGPPQHQPAASGVDFNREMREIRRAVDKYLAQGQIEPAEEFMEQRRQYLSTQGYYIRKLNQAYFAFHGTYADSSTSVSPIGVEMKALREQSASLKDFLETAATMTSRRDLRLRLGEPAGTPE